MGLDIWGPEVGALIIHGSESRAKQGRSLGLFPGATPSEVLSQATLSMLLRPAGKGIFFMGSMRDRMV